MSQLGWVIFGQKEAEAVQTLIGALKETDARDELGLGAIRDSYADLLFPGTSTVQTRLRYFLLLPQVFRELKLKPGGDHRQELRKAEVGLIKDFRALKGADTAFLIGTEAGERLKRMPSSVYWGGLGAWKIRLPDKRRASIGQTLDAMARGEACWDEFPFAGWDRGFHLCGEERDWLIERLSALRLEQGGTVLGQLVLQAKGCSALQKLDDVAQLALPAPLMRQLRQALKFSSLMHGAALLYNLMLAEHFDHDSLERYRQALAEWGDTRPPLDATAEDLLAPLIKAGPLIGFAPSEKTLRFIKDWIGVARQPNGKDARDLIHRRERSVKPGRARLDLDRQDYTWTGSSGAGRLTYRWERVQQYLRDLAAA
jgi:hypothetical protein